MNLLIVEDEQTLAHLLKNHFNNFGYHVVSAYTGSEAIDAITYERFDVVILDLSLPELDGLDVLMYLKSLDIETNVIILSARGDATDRVKGLKYGANDYLAKPFDLEELTIRVENLFNQYKREIPLTISLGPLLLHTSEKKLSDQTFNLPLTKKEYDILEYLSLHLNEPKNSEEIFNHVWSVDSESLPSTVRYHISVLKKKIMKSFNVDIIDTIHGQGYIIRKEEEKE